MLACLTTRERVLLGVVGLVVVTTAALEYGGGSDVAVFLVGALALAGVAWVVSFSTEAVGERFGPALTGIVQSAVGNLPGSSVCIFALRAGLVTVVQASLVGSILGNALLVLGLAFIAGGWRHGRLRFGPGDASRTTPTLLLLAVFMVSTLASPAGWAPAMSTGDLGGRRAGSPAVFGVWVSAPARPGGRRRPARTPRSSARDRVPRRRRRGGGVRLGLVRRGARRRRSRQSGSRRSSPASSSSESPATRSRTSSASRSRTKARIDLAISVMKNSVAQIAVFLFPLLVLLSLFLASHLTFLLPPVYVGALFLMAISVWQVTQDGEAVAFEGLALVGFYVILAVLTFYESETSSKRWQPGTPRAFALPGRSWSRRSARRRASQARLGGQRARRRRRPVTARPRCRSAGSEGGSGGPVGAPGCLVEDEIEDHSLRGPAGGGRCGSDRAGSTGRPPGPVCCACRGTPGRAPGERGGRRDASAVVGSVDGAGADERRRPPRRLLRTLCTLRRAGHAAAHARVGTALRSTTSPSSTPAPASTNLRSDSGG